MGCNYIYRIIKNYTHEEKKVIGKFPAVFISMLGSLRNAYSIS